LLLAIILMVSRLFCVKDSSGISRFRKTRLFLAVVFLIRNIAKRLTAVLAKGTPR
jgi:hypothetical protein